MKGRWLLWAAIALVSCDCAAVGTTESSLTILSFEIRETDPPGDPRGESLVVVPGTHVTLAWALDANARRVTLAANDDVLGQWDGADDPGYFVDACDATRCTTAEASQILYTLTAIHPDGAMDSQSLLVTVSSTGLQILHLAVSPTRLLGAGTTELRWSTAGAYLTEIWAEPLDGGDRTRVGAFELPLAHEGRIEHRVDAPTRFELIAVAPDGSRVSADATVRLGNEPHFSTFTATPAFVRPGETTTLAWKGSGIVRLSILRDDGRPPIVGIHGAEAEEGTRTVEVHGEVRFRLVGTSTDGETVETLCDASGCRDAVVEVLPPPRTRILSFRAEPASIALGETSLLRFESESADGLRLLWQDESGLQERLFGPEAENFEVAPTVNTTYTLQALRKGQVASTAMVSVEVRPRVELFVETDAETGGVWAGETTLVRWTTAGALFLQLDLDGRPLDLTGLDPAADELEIDIPDLEEGARLSLVLTAFGPHALETASRTLVVHRR